MLEKWRRFRETDLYCTKDGQVFKGIQGREVGHKGYRDYIYISLGARGLGTKKRARIIAECWITYPEMLPKDMEVHHINKVRTDDRACNLQVLTKEEHYRIHSVKEYSMKRVIMDNDVIFNSISKANEYLGVKHNCGGHISECCIGKRRTFKGHTWKYA